MDGITIEEQSAVFRLSGDGRTAHVPLYVPAKYRDSVRPRLESRFPNLPRLNDRQQSDLIRFLAMIENLDEKHGSP